MQQGFMSQSGMISIFQDFPFSPDMVNEIKVVSSSYEPQYGSSTSGQIVATTKSGSDKFHGSAFDYHQRDSLNAKQWGATDKSPLKKNNFGANIGGPAKLPVLWSNYVKTYFYVNFEGFRQTGGVNRPTLSIPSESRTGGRLLGLARLRWEPHPDLRPGHDPRPARRDRGQGSLPRQRHPVEPHHPTGQPVPAVPAEPHERRTPQQLPRADRHSRQHPRRLQLLLRALRHVRRPEGPPGGLDLAPAGAAQVLLDAPPRDRQRDLVRPPELLGQPGQLGPHLRTQRAQPLHLRLSEPERRLRLRQRRRGRPAAQDRGRGQQHHRPRDRVSAMASRRWGATPEFPWAT